MKEITTILSHARKVTALTGAGISAESGVPTFRGEDGLWRNFRAEELATPFAFEKDPKLIWEWYDWRRGLISKCAPNPAHRTLVDIEAHFDDFTLITQNVDGLHQLAGSNNIITIHGNIFTIRCTKCGLEKEDRTVPLTQVPPKCGCGGLFRPSVVWFGEMLNPNDLAGAQAAASKSDVMFVIGTSAVVHPAAGLPMVAKGQGATILEFNLEPTPITGLADASFFGKAGEELPKFWTQVQDKLSK